VTFKVHTNTNNRHETLRSHANTGHIFLELILQQHAQLGHMLTLWELLVTEGLQLIVVIFNYSVLLKMLMRTAMCGPIKLRSTSDSDTTCR
jgi:hypothetical protein